MLDQALAALHQTTGVKVGILEFEHLVTRADAPVAALAIEADGRRFNMLATIKPRIDRETALAAAHTQMGHAAADNAVLVTAYLPARLADQCRDNLGLQFIDTAGNAYLRQRGLYIWVKGQPRPTDALNLPATRAAATATAQRIIFLLLCRPELLNAPYREIAKTAGVALGVVGRVLKDLADQKYIIGQPRGWRFLEPARLLDQWVTNYPARLRPKLNARRFTAEDRTWWQKTDLVNTGALWGGEVAGDKLTRHLKPATFTIYVAPAVVHKVVTDLATGHRWRADPKGEIEILETFWNLPVDPAHPDIVPPPLIYADLLATMDPRNREVAILVKEQAIEYALRPD